MQRYYKYVLFVLIISISLLLNNCKKESSQNIKKEIPYVTITHIKQITYKPVLSYTGTVYPYDEALVKPAIAGVVDDVYVKEGEYVSKGRLLAKVMSELVIQTKAKLDALEKNYNRMKVLYQKGSISAKDYDRIEAEYKATKAQYEMALKLSEIRSPISGQIVEVNYKPNEVVSVFPSSMKFSYNGVDAKDYMFRILDLSYLKVKIKVSQNDILKIKKGLSAYIIFNGKKIKGYIYSKPKYLSSIDRTGEVEILLKIFPKNLLPGMSVNVEIPYKKEKVYAIDMASVILDPISRKNFIYIVDENNIIKRVFVNIIDYYKNYAILDNLDTNIINEDTKIVLKGANVVKEGIKVRY